MASKAKNAIINSFLKLINTEDFDKITVTALVEECGISRQTFYYHFDDVDEMLAYAFERETKGICDSQITGRWLDSAELYADFLSRYDTLLRKASRSSGFLKVYNLLYSSFYQYISSYVEKKNGKKPLLKADSNFLIACLASSLCGLVVTEIQKDKSDYAALVNRIAGGFKIIPN